MTLLQLFFTFFLIGLFTIGGGQVAITIMQQYLVDTGIIDSAEFFSMVAVSESTPGPIGINMATYVGCKLYGVFGGVVITFGTVLPSLIVIMLIAGYYEKIQKNNLVQSAFSALRPGVTGLVAVAAWQIIALAVVNVQGFTNSGSFSELFDLKTLAAYLVFKALLLFTKVNPILVIAAGGVFGLVFL